MDDKKKLYDGLLGLGFTESELGTFDTFSANLDNPEKNKVFYDALIGSKRVNVEQLGTYDTFSAKTLKKKEDTGVGSSEPIKTAQQSLLDAEKHPATPKADVDRAVDERIETNWKLNNINLWEKALKTPIGQERWSGDDRLKVREYNNTLSDISATTQEKDVQHYFNVLKSPEMKLLQGTDKVEENLSEALKNKYKRLQALHKYLQDKRIIIGDEYRPIENDPLKRWDDYNIPDWDKKLNIAVGRWLNHAIGGNLLTKIAEAQQTPEQQSKDVQESIDIEAKYQPSMLEDLSAKAFSFLADAPVFAVLGEVSEVGGRMVVKSTLNNVTRELMAQGVTREAAQGIALKGMSKMTQLGVESLSNGVTQGITLGVYNTINSTLGQYEEAYANGEDVEHFDWRRTLYEGGEGFLMGLSTGIVSPLFSKAESTVDAIVEHSLARNMAKLGLATTGFATEASIFAAVPASLQGRIPTKKEIVESGLMLLAIKGGVLPLKLAGRVNVSKAKHDPIDYTDRELELLGIKDNPYETIKNMSKEDIEKIYTNPKIPVVTAWKVIENHAGIAPVGVAYPDVVKVEKEGDRTFLRSYTKTENGYDLLSESEYPDKTSADAAASVGIEQIFDEKIKDRIHDASTREKGLLKSSLNKLEPKEKDAMMEAFDTPVFARTSEQKRLTDKFYEITDGVLGTGKNAYESELTKHFFDEKQPESDTVAQQPKAEEIGQKTAPIEAKKEEIQNEIKPENIFDLRENLLTLQKEQYGREVKKEQGATISGEARGVDVRGESLAVDTGKKARYDVGGSAGITRDASVREISTPDAEIAESGSNRPIESTKSIPAKIKDVEVLSASLESLEGKEAKTKSEEVKSRLQEVINENRKTFDRIDPRYTKYLLDKVNKAKPSNVTRTVNEIKKILESGEKQNSIKQAYEARDKIRTFRSSPRWSEFVKGIDLKSGFMGKKLSIKLSGIPVENLPDGVINDYIETVNNLTSKTPDYNQVKNFINSYEAEIRKQQDLANIQTYDSDKAITRINDRITRIRDNMQKAETPEQIVALKMELGKLKGEAVKMKKLGIYEEDDGKVKVWDAKEAEIEEFLKNLPQFSEEMQGKVKALETEYKKTTTNEISERWDNIKRKEATEKGNPYLDTPEGKVVNDIYTALGKAVNDEWAIERLSMNDISEMKDALDLIDETGIAPIVVLEKENKIKGAVMASKAKGRIFDAVNANKDHVQVMRFLGLSEEDMKKKIAQRPDIHIGSLLNLTRRMEADPLFLKPIFKSLQSMIDNPIYNIVTHPGSEAINASERMIKDFLNPVYKEFGKQTQNIFERYVFDFGKNRKDVKIFDRLHILEAQLRVWDLMNNFKGRVIQTGERFYGTELNGTPYKEDGKIKYFDTADEAIKYVKAQPTDKVGDRPLDFYDLVNFDIKDGRKVPSVERKNAVIARGTKTNELEKRMFDEAYGELLDRTKAKDLSGIRSEQDVLKILTPEEKELWKLIKKVYNDSKPYMDIVAGREGLALKHEENYTPMNVRSMSDVAYDSNATMNDLYDQVQNGHRPQVTTNILRKGNQLKYIDFNGLRVLEKYVRDMSMSYHVLPAMRTQLSALGMNVEEYKDTDISNFAKALRTNIVDGYKIEYSKRSMFGNIKIATSKDVYDVSKGIRLMAQGIRNKLLNKMIRPAQDIVPNSIKTGTKGVFRVENKPAWKTFYSFNPGVAGNIERLRYGQSKIGEYEAIERKGAMQSFTNEWIGTGDDFTKGKWQYTFMDAYKKLTGQDFDVNRYVYDWEYRDKINGQDEFEQSKAIADGFIEENLVPLNKYSNRKAVNMLGWRMSTGERMYDFLNAMSSYTAQENMGAIAYLNDIRFNLYSKEADAVKVRRAAMIKLGQVIISNMAYNLMTQAAFNATAYGAGAVFKDERVKESAIENLKGMFSAKNTMANGILSAVNLMFGGYMNVGRTMLSLAYNGYKGMSKLDMNKREAYEFDTNIRFLDQKLGLNRYIDPTLDLSKSSIPWETAVNTLFPVIGSNMTQMALDVKTLATQPYNYVQGKMAEDKYDANEFKGFELLKAVNSLFMAYTIPVSADINNMSRAMLSQQSRKVPEEVKDADILLHNFTLTNDEVRQMYEDKYKDVYDRAKKAGDENPMETALEAADRVEKTYLMDKDDNDYYSFYWNNKKNIDILGDVLMDVVNDKSMKISERKEWFKKINANATDLQEQFNGYQKGEDNMFMVDDEILARWIEKGLDQRWESTNKNIKQNMIKIQSQYGR